MLGKLIGSYQITGELAQGRLGPIYRGQSVDQTREVVIKTINLQAFPASTQVQLKARFRREVFVQRQLQHPNIVQVYDFLNVEDKFYLVQEFVTGSSLRDLLSRQGVPNVPQAVYLVKQVLGALDYAHRFSYLDQSDFQRTGLVHGDLKPSNLLLDQKGRLRVTDFSILNKVLGGEGRRAVAAVYEQDNDYLAPEQARGITPDVSSDIYSLGMTFYEMLTGRVPFTNWSRSGALDMRRLTGEAEAQSLTQLRPDVPPQLALVIARATKRNPKERFATAADLLRALRDCEAQINKTELLTRADTLQRALTGGTAEGNLPVPAPPKTLQRPSQAFPPQLQPAAQMVPPERAARRQVTRVEPFRRNSAAFPVPPPMSLPRATPVNVDPPRFAELSKRRDRWLLPGFFAAVLIGTLVGAYFFSSPSSNEGRASEVARQVVPSTVLAPEPQDTLATAPAAPTQNVLSLQAPKPLVAVPNSPVLALARQAEQRESYGEAIRAYEEFLAANPAAPYVPIARARAANLRIMQGLLSNARAAFAESRFSEARQHYAEALKLRPASSVAQAGWRDAGARLIAPGSAIPASASASAKPETQSDIRPEAKPESNKEAVRESKGEARDDASEKPARPAAKPTPSPTPIPQN